MDMERQGRPVAIMGIDNSKRERLSALGSTEGKTITSDPKPRKAGEPDLLLLKHSKVFLYQAMRSLCLSGKEDHSCRWSYARHASAKSIITSVTLAGQER